MRRKQLSSNPTPHWLAEVNQDSVFNRQNVLTGSIYYPGCRFDAEPIEAYGGFAHSFVYVDYYCDKASVVSLISRIGGYAPLLIKDVSMGELSEYSCAIRDLRVSDFYGAQVYDSIQELMCRAIANADESVSPYAVWAVLERKERTNPGHGPDRFSLLYIFGEGVATYQALYNSNRICPMSIVLCGADIGFGRNWTLFEKKDGIFERVVMSNPAGIPKYLFAWSRYDPLGSDERWADEGVEMYWQKYTQKIPSRSYLSIWTTQDSA
jgi:hypothetical protein